MVNISERIFYIGVNDRKKHLFENNWPLPYGVSYNSYLIRDEKTAVIDTIEYGSNGDYLNNIVSILGGKKLDYLIINHMEPDHSSMIGEVFSKFSEVKIVGNSKTFNLLNSYFSLPKENFMEVTDGEVLDMGYHKLKFVFTPWVHWPETMMTYDITESILFSCDGFGSYGTLDGGIFDDELDIDFYESEARRYYSNIVGKWSGMVQKAIKKFDCLPIKCVCPSHGPIWRSDPTKILCWYDRWSKYEAEEGVVIAFASMYGNTEKMADSLARSLSEAGLKKIRIYDVSKTNASYILSDIWKYKGIILGTCAYNADMHPMMAHICNEIAISAPKNRVLGIFGSSSWNGAGVKALKGFAEKHNYPITGDVVEVMGAPDEAKMVKFESFAKVFVEEVKRQ